MPHPPGYNLDKRGEHVGAKSERNWIQTVVNGGNSGSSLTHLTFSGSTVLGEGWRPFGRWFREIQENLWDFLAALSQTPGEKGKECRGHRKTEGVATSKQQETRIE